MADKELISLKSEKLIEMTSGFCRECLDEEYQGLCEKLIRKMARKRNVPFLSGRIDIWAAAIVYAIGSINFLFDQSFEPYSSTADICGYFGVSKSTTGQKAGVIRKMFRLEHWDKDFSTKRMTEDNPLANFVMVDGFIVSKENVPSLF